MKKQLHFMAGVPRSGSTVLAGSTNSNGSTGNSIDFGDITYNPTLTNGVGFSDCHGGLL